MSMDNMQNRAVEIAELYDQLNRAQGRESWTDSDYVAGLVGDVGDLSKVSMGLNGLRPIENAEAKFEHELHDILWSVMVLASRNGLELSSGFMATMDNLETKIKAQLSVEPGV